MSTYFVGDIHGCYKNLKNILDYVHFDPNIDFLFLTGDLVSRGSNSLEVLRFIKKLNKSARTVLGNHDLNLLKTYFCEVNHKKHSPFRDILHAPDVDSLIDWLRKQSILYVDENKKILLSHAGINPKWNINQTKLYAQEIEKILSGNYPHLLFQKLSPLNKHKINNIHFDKLKKIQDYVISFTKMRYIYNDGTLDLQYKDNPKYVPNKNIYPWFNLVGSITSSGYHIIFGHWASLKNTNIPIGIYALDSGCCWGGYLSLLRWEDKKIIKHACLSPD